MLYVLCFFFYRSPNESIEFTYSYVHSAFTRVKSPVWETYQKQNDQFTKIRHSIEDSSDNPTNSDSPHDMKQINSITNERKACLSVSKRPSIRSEEYVMSPKKRTKTGADIESTSSVKRSPKQQRIVPVLQRRNSKLEKLAASPPFFGFDATEKNMKINGFSNILTSSKGRNGDNEALQRLAQEKEDLEFAKKLQEEFNRNSTGRYLTRQGCNRSKTNSSRQVTLDEMITI